MAYNSYGQWYWATTYDPKTKQVVMSWNKQVRKYLESIEAQHRWYMKLAVFPEMKSRLMVEV